MRYAILGAAYGFGNLTAQYLLEQPDTEAVLAIGRNPRPAEPFSLNVGATNIRYRYQQIDICKQFPDLAFALNAFSPDVVINFAALAVSQEKRRWQEFLDENVQPIVKLTVHLERQPYFRKFIQIGSSEVYGSVTEAATESTVLNPTSPYSGSKAAADMFLMGIRSEFPLNIIRPSNCYGPGQKFQRAIPRLIYCGLSGEEKFKLEGGGEARKSFLHARDLASAVHLVATKAENGKIYNVGPPRSMRIKDLAGCCIDAMGIRDFWDVCEYAPPRPGEDREYLINSDAIKQDLGWKQEIFLEEGLAEMVEWGRKYLPQLREIRKAA